MSEPRTIKQIGPNEQPDRIAATLAAAFQDDPALSWIVPDPEKRRHIAPKFFGVMAEQSYRLGEVLGSEDAGAASLWFPAGEVKDGLFTRLKDDLRLGAIFGRNLMRGLKVANAIYAHHPSPQPHVYLRYVGVAPQAQGKGWGGAVIRAGIARAAEKGLGVLLETATESNVAIYTRLGFTITEEWHVPGGGPKFWTMVRPAD